MFAALLVTLTGCSCLAIGYALGYRAGVYDTRAGLSYRRGKGGRRV